MAVSPRNQVIFVVCLLGFMDRVLATRESGKIACVQCTPAEPRCESGNLEPTLCEESDSYCALYRVFIDDTQGVYRGCSEQRMQGCRITTLWNRAATICYETCFWDGCNGDENTRGSLL